MESRRFLFSLLALLPVIPVDAQTTNVWTSSVSGKWETAGNWSAGAPTNSHAANLITNLSPKTVTIDSNTTFTAITTLTISNLLISGNVNTMQLVNAYLLYVLNETTLSNATLSISNAVMRVGNSPNAKLLLDGDVVVISTNSLLLATNGTTVVGGALGTNSPGTLNIFSGQVQLNDLVVAGATGSVGTVTVAGGALTNMGTLMIGSQGSGTFWMKGGQLFINNQDIQVGESSGSFSAGNGRLAVSNGTVFARRMFVGGNAPGSLTIAGGSVLLSSNLVVGRTALGNAVITGGALIATNFGQSLVGDQAGGELVVSNTGLARFRHLTVANGTSLSGAGPCSGTLTVGGGSLELLASMTVAANTNATGVVWVNGGQVTVTNASTAITIGSFGKGSFTQSNGLVRANSESVGGTFGSIGTLTVVGGTNFTGAGGLFIGAFGTGTVWVTGGLLSNSVTTIGRGSSLNVSNGNVWITTADLGTFSGTPATLTVAGGDYRGVTINIGRELSNTGTVWITGGTTTVVTVRIGYNGAGFLTQSNGSMIATQEEIGYNAANLARTLRLAGGVHNVGILTVGVAAGATGSVWMTGGELSATTAYFAYRGNGTLTQSNGTISARLLRAGHADGNVSQTGTLNFFGGTANVYSNLIAGDICIVEATGVVKVAGGTLAVTNATGNALLDIRTGTLEVSAGTLRADKIVITNSCAFLTYTGGSIVCTNVMLHPSGDADGDGMPNGWENQYGFNPIDPSDAGLDPDGDGLTNQQEYTANSNPLVHKSKNSWIIGTSNWDCGFCWDQNSPPNSNQAAFVTNSGNRIVSINFATPINAPNSMTVSTLTVSAFSLFSSVNATLSHAGAGTTTPFRVLNDFTLGAGGNLVVTNARFLAQGGVNMGGLIAVRTQGIFAASSPLNIGGLNKTGTVVVTGGHMVITNTPATVGAGDAFIIDGSVTLTNASSIVVSNVPVVVNGSLTVLGGSLSVSNMVTSRGTITIAGGSNNFSSALRVGNGVGPTGTLWVTGGNVNVTNTFLIVGDSGPGQMTMSNGLVKVKSFYVGNLTGSMGALTFAGGALSLSDLTLGNNSGSAGLVWMTGGTLGASNTIVNIGGLGSGQVTLSNGTLTAADLGVAVLSGQSSLTIAGGTVSATNMTLGRLNCASIGTVAINGGGLFVTNAAGNAALNILSGTVFLNSGTLIVDKLVITNACGHLVRNGGTLIIGATNMLANLDADADGIPNGYEQSNGLNPFNPSDAGLDRDGDGLSELQEYLAGTSPTNNASAFRITAIVRTNNDVRVTWITGPGKTNALERTAGVAGSFSNNFVALTNLITTGTVTNYLDLGAATNVPAFYYRVRLAP